jgi:hypothetical protein
MPLDAKNTQYQTIKFAFMAMRGWFRNLIPDRRFSRPFDECDTHEIARIAQDLGLTQNELLQMARLRPDAASLLFKRLENLHLDAKALATMEPGVMRDLQRLCSTCESKGRCQRDLARGDDSEWRDYCPNQDTLIALQQGADVGD